MFSKIWFIAEIVYLILTLNKIYPFGIFGVSTSKVIIYICVYKEGKWKKFRKESGILNNALFKGNWLLRFIEILWDLFYLSIIVDRGGVWFGNFSSFYIELPLFSLSLVTSRMLIVFCLTSSRVGIKINIFIYDWLLYFFDETGKLKVNKTTQYYSNGYSEY